MNIEEQDKLVNCVITAMLARMPSRRDLAAFAALQGLLANRTLSAAASYPVAAAMYADELLAELDKVRP